MRRRTFLLVLGGFGLLAAATALGGWLCYPTVIAEDPDAAALRIDQQQHAARGFGTDSARVDSQLTLAIPGADANAAADAVFAYMVEHYVGQEHVLQAQFPGLNLHGQPKSDVSVFTDTYFDTPALDLYRWRNSCRARFRTSTTNPDDRKSGRRLVQMKVTPPTDFTLRNELKYQVAEPKAGSRKPIDLHPLLGLIAKDQRADFFEVYRKAGIDAWELREVFTIRQTRRRGYLNWDNENVFSFSVDTGEARVLGGRGSFASVDLGLVEIAYTEADEAKRKTMWAIRDAIVADLQQHFPGMKQNTQSKYNIVLEQMMRQMPLLPLLHRLGVPLAPRFPLLDR